MFGVRRKGGVGDLSEVVMAYGGAQIQLMAYDVAHLDIFMEMAVATTYGDDVAVEVNVRRPTVQDKVIRYGVRVQTEECELLILQGFAPEADGIATAQCAVTQFAQTGVYGIYGKQFNLRRVTVAEVAVQGDVVARRALRLFLGASGEGTRHHAEQTEGQYDTKWSGLCHLS